MDRLELAPAKLDHVKAEVQDPLVEADLGFDSKPRSTFISGLLDEPFWSELIDLWCEFRDHFAWDYSYMPGLDRSLMEHRLLIKEGFRPYKKPSRKLSDELTLKAKEEIKWQIHVYLELRKIVRGTHAGANVDTIFRIF
ncbi:hypothetical protein CRG98_021991 [Punica granatum]|uniref:Uncharacterized protein n=1 Tax=Punica granatum TaxID=22663 RepID=A0A2I0JP08_PUNGR|nr:hypothetical protein CRG98_021991 [Punica granatum]